MRISAAFEPIVFVLPVDFLNQKIKLSAYLLVAVEH